VFAYITTSAEVTTLWKIACRSRAQALSERPLVFHSDDLVHAGERAPDAASSSSFFAGARIPRIEAEMAS